MTIADQALATEQRRREAVERKAMKVIEIARAIFTAKAPYWSDSAYEVVWLPVHGLGTFGVTERGQLIYDPVTTVEWSGKWGEECIAGVVAHEVMHVILLHMLRRGDRDPKVWNIAADIFINQMLREAGWKLPPCGVFPEDFKTKDGKRFPTNLTADEYYDLLMDGATNNQGQPVAQQGSGKEGPCSGSCGTGAGGEKLDGEPAAGAEGGDAERSTSDLRSTADRAARATADAAARGVGDIPGAMKRWATAHLKPPEVHWSQHLRIAGRNVIARAGQGKRTYRRPNRRQACLGMHPRTPVLPVNERTVATVWFAIDTSGSMSDGEILRCASELVAIAKMRRGRVFALACDTKVQAEPVELKGNYLPTLERIIKGGGGTNFVPIFEEVERANMRDKPDLVVIGTDSGGPAPRLAPKVPTIWLSTVGRRPSGCEWGQLIHLKRTGRGAA